MVRRRFFLGVRAPRPSDLSNVCYNREQRQNKKFARNAETAKNATYHM